MVKIKLNLTKLDKERFFKGEKGTCADLVLIDYKDGPKYDNDGFVKQDCTKEEQLDAAQYLQRVLEVFQGEIESAYAEGYKDCSAALNETVHAVRAAMQHDWNQGRSKRVARS